MKNNSVMKSVLFVCLGNICRSPLAHGVAADYIEKNGLDILVDSCGTSDWHTGEAPCHNSIKVGSLHSIDISSLEARQIVKDDFEKFDMIIALDDSNVSNILNLGCPPHKLTKLGLYGYKNQDVPDPYFFDGFEGFEKVYTMIEECTIELIKTNKKND